VKEKKFMLRAEFWKDDPFLQMAARPSGLPLKMGTHGGSYNKQTIAKFQFALLIIGVFRGQHGFPPYQFSLTVTGVFDQQTRVAVEDFQAKEGLRIDGKAQVETLHRMDQRLETIEAPLAIKRFKDLLKDLKLPSSGPSVWSQPGSPGGVIPGGSLDDVMGGLIGTFGGR
jgi:hypothetical protein